MSLPLSKSRDPAKRKAFEDDYIATVEATVKDYYDEDEDEKRAADFYRKGNFARKSKPTYEELNNLLSTEYRHAKRRSNLFPCIDRHPDGTLRCVYTGEVLETEECVRLKKCNEEHTLPQSWHAGSATHPGADMHQLFAAGQSANSFRKNHPFGVAPEGARPKRESDAGCIYAATEDRGTFFEPKENAGACARAVCYILVAYPKTTHPELLSPEMDLPNLLNAAADASTITLWERHRNAELHRLQGNRNPFIDHPEWALTLNFSEAFTDGGLAGAEGKKLRRELKKQAREEKRAARERLRRDKQARKGGKRAARASSSASGSSSASTAESSEADASASSSS